MTTPQSPREVLRELLGEGIAIGDLAFLYGMTEEGVRAILNDGEEVTA